MEDREEKRMVEMEFIGRQAFFIGFPSAYIPIL